MLWKWEVWNGCVLDWLNPQPKPKADPGMCWDHSWAAGEVGSGTTRTQWHQELAFSRFFCTSTPAEWHEDEDEWWFPDKLLGRGHLAQSPPKVSPAILQAQPDLTRCQQQIISHLLHVLRFGIHLWTYSNACTKPFSCLFIFFLKPTKPFLLNAEIKAAPLPTLGLFWINWQCQDCRTGAFQHAWKQTDPPQLVHAV